MKTKIPAERIKELEIMLLKAKNVLLNWSPGDDFFPEIEIQFNDFIQDIERVLKNEN